MHTGGHGRAKSRKPEVKIGVAPEGLAQSKEELEEAIVGYAKQNMHQAQIGQMLKEKHGVMYVRQVFGKRLGEILGEKGVANAYPQDFLDLIKKAVVMRSHITKNNKDTYSKIRLKRIESKIWRLTKYYKRVGAIPLEWKYDPEQAALIVKGR